MAQVWRSAAAICKSSMSASPCSIFKTLSRRPIPSAARPIPYTASRHASVLGSVESMLPLHSTVAIARLKSNIAIDSASWSWLSQDFAMPR
ncbi:uncharacterized protein LOC142547061 [Primulina tabacum]|uniref:uncharacterized protein LOC142547061 n=1 Tax=Primulina tabacum TaxID=48773 RepID=UPI003F5939D6